MNTPAPVLDLSKPSYQGAHHIARELAHAHMHVEGRKALNEADVKIYRAEFARLLWHVEGRNGGFLGLDDEQNEQRAKRLGLPKEYVTAGLYDPGHWPQAVTAEVAA